MADEEIKVLLTADDTQFKAGMEESAAAVNASMAQMKTGVAAASGSVTQMGADFTALDEIMAGHVKKAQDVAAAQQALDRLMAQGAITAKEQAAALEALTASERLTASEKAALMAATEADTAATEENTAAMAINGQSAREIGVLIGELARGNYHRLEGSTITLANRTGLLSSAFRFLLSPAGLVSIAFASVGATAVSAANDIDTLRGSVLNTGKASGMDVDDLRNLEEALTKNGATLREARQAVEGLNSSGRILGTSMQDAGEAAVDMAQLTGTSMDKAVAQLVRIAEDPKHAMASLDAQMHVLSQSQADHIAKLQDEGHKAEAAAEAIRDLRKAEDERVVAQRKAGDGSNGFIFKREAMFGNTWERTKQLFEGSNDNPRDDYDENTAQLQRYTKLHPSSFKSDASGMTSFSNDDGFFGASTAQHINELLQQRVALVDQIKERKESIAQQSKAQADLEDRVQAALGGKGAKGSGNGEDHAAAQADRDQYNEQRLAHGMSLQDEQRFWQGKLDAAKRGTQEYRQAVNELLQIKQKESQQGVQAERKEEAEAKRAAAEKVRAAKQTAEEQKRAAQQQLQLDEAQAASTRRLTDATLQTKKTELSADLAQGKITNEQALASYTALIHARYEADLAYYQQKEKLEATDKAKLAEDQTNLAISYQHMLQQLAQAQEQFHKTSENQWSRYAQRIAGSVQSAVNGMIFQHVTLQHALANIVMSIGEDIIQFAVEKPLQKWIEAESVKLSAAISTITGQQSATAAARAEDEAQGIAASVAAVARASGVAGANGIASFSAAPWPVDMGAPAFGASMMAAAASIGSVASAAGGWDRVPVDGTMTELHRDEMVLPKSVADPVRNMAKGGGSQGGGGVVHVHAMDSRSFVDFLNRNPRAISSAMNRAGRNGWR